MRDGCTNLHGHALAPRTAAKEVRPPRAQHNERHQTRGDGVLASVTYVKYQAHAPIGAFAPGAVGKYDGKAHEGEEGKEQCDVFVAEGADCQKHASKECTDGANDDADRDSDGTHKHEAAIGVEQAFDSARYVAFRHFVFRHLLS